MAVITMQNLTDLTSIKIVPEKQPMLEFLLKLETCQLSPLNALPKS